MEYKMKAEGFYIELPYGRLDISGNEENGFRPYQLLVSSLAVCSGGILRTILAKMRLKVDDVQIIADTERNPKIANRIDKVFLHFKIKGSHLSDEKVAKALKLTTKNCAMVQSVIDSIEVCETYEIIEE